MRWIVLDGIDATGKTTLKNVLIDHLASEGLSALSGPEFSESFVGRGIRSVIDEHRFYATMPGRNTFVSDLLVILSDVFCKYETEIDSNCHAYISDRGVVSALAYQMVRLDNAHPGFLNSEAEGAIIDMLGHIASHIKWPELHVNLIIDSEEMDRRIIARGEAPLDEARRAELLAVQATMRRYGPMFRAKDISVSGRSPDEISTDILSAWKRRWD